MASLRAKITNRFLFLTGLKTFYDDPAKVPGKVAKLRAKGPDMPKESFRRKFNITDIPGYDYPVYKVEPKTKAADASKDCVLYLHGGGYVLDIAWAHWNFIGRLAEAKGCAVIVPLYPLAPEHKCAEVVPAMISLYADTAKLYGGENTVIMGDSAGGGLTLAVAHAARDQKLPAPSKLVMLSPWLDAGGTHPDQPALEAKDTMICVAGLRGFAGMYAGDLALDDPRVSPLFGDHKNLPPVQVFVSSEETLYPDSTRFRDQMAALGTPVNYREYKDMFHVWPLLAVPEGKQAMREIAAFLG